MKEFRLDRKWVYVLRACLLVFIAFLALGLALPFLPGDGAGHSAGNIVTAILCVIVFGFFTLATWLILKNLPFVDVVVDDDGIWYRHLGKDRGLIAWGQVATVRERPYLQRLDLRDAAEVKLLSVEYQLTGFEELRRILIGRIRPEIPDTAALRFSKGGFYHGSYLLGILGLIALGIYVGATEDPLVGYGGMVVLVAIVTYEYAFTATAVEIGRESLEISYPVARKTIAFEDIADIRLSDEFHRGNRIPRVLIVSKRFGRPFVLKQLGVDSSFLVALLRKAVGR